MRVVIGLLIAMFGAVFQSPTGEADEILTQLSKIRLDKKQIYNIRDITIRRDVLTIALNRGTIAFLEPVNGKVTGAVFLGSGEIVAIPPDTTEKQQIYRFTGTPILNDAFETALLRFTDNTYQEIKTEISQHAQEDVSADDAAQFDSWETSLAARATVLNLRLLADFLEPAGRPLFLAELKAEKAGWFNVVFDPRVAEEVSIFQLREIANTTVGDVWASFNQRSEARRPEAVAHENKSPVDILAYDVEGTSGADNKIEAKVTMRAKTRLEGARVLTFSLASSLRLASVMTDTDEPVQYYQYPNVSDFSIVLPRALKADQDLTLRFSYAGDVAGQVPWYPLQRQQTIPSFKSNLTSLNDRPAFMLEYSNRKIIPASYHDQWLMEGLSRYLKAVSDDGNDSAGTSTRKLLNDTREELKTVEGTGPIWLGQRLASTITPSAYRAVYAKGVWVIHMLRMMLRQDGPAPDAKFQAMLEDFVARYDGRAVSTWDFKDVAEKHADKKLDWFFDQWVFATGLPSYSVDYKAEPSGNEFTIEGTITQSGVPDGFVMSVPLYADGEYLGRVEVGDLDGKFRFRARRKPDRLVIDPEMTILTPTSQ